MHPSPVRFDRLPGRDRGSASCISKRHWALGSGRSGGGLDLERGSRGSGALAAIHSANPMLQLAPCQMQRIVDCRIPTAGSSTTNKFNKLSTSTRPQPPAPTWPASGPRSIRFARPRTCHFRDPRDRPTTSTRCQLSVAAACVSDLHSSASETAPETPTDRPACRPSAGSPNPDHCLRHLPCVDSYPLHPYLSRGPGPVQELRHLTPLPSPVLRHAHAVAKAARAALLLCTPSPPSHSASS